MNEHERKSRGVLATNLKVWIEKNGVTQAQAAEKLGTNPRTLRKFFTGVRVPDDDMVTKMKAFLKVDPKKPAAKPKKKVTKKKLVKLRTKPPEPEELPFEVETVSESRVLVDLVRKVDQVEKKQSLEEILEHTRALSSTEIALLLGAVEKIRLRVPMAKIGVSKLMGISNRIYCSWVRGEDLPDPPMQVKLRTVYRLIQRQIETADQQAAERRREKQKQWDREIGAARERRVQKAADGAPLSFAEIEDIRVAWGFTKRAMSGYLGVTEGTYQNWKRGYTLPSASKCVEYRRKLRAKPAAPAQSQAPTAQPTQSSRRRSPNAAEIEAACMVTKAWISSGVKMTPDEVVYVLSGVVDTFVAAN